MRLPEFRYPESSSPSKPPWRPSGLPSWWRRRAPVRPRSFRWSWRRPTGSVISASWCSSRGDSPPARRRSAWPPFSGKASGRPSGYRIRRDTRRSAATRVEVVTEGILTRMLQSDPTLDLASDWWFSTNFTSARYTLTSVWRWRCIRNVCCAQTCAFWSCRQRSTLRRSPARGARWRGADHRGVRPQPSGRDALPREFVSRPGRARRGDVDRAGASRGRRRPARLPAGRRRDSSRRRSPAEPSVGQRGRCLPGVRDLPQRDQDSCRSREHGRPAQGRAGDRPWRKPRSP